MANTIMAGLINDMEHYGFDDFDSSTLARLIDEAHKEFCLREPWPFLERQETVTISSGSDTLTTSGTLGKVIALINSVDGNALEPMRTDTQLKNFAQAINRAGLPTRYYFLGDALKLYPTADSSVNLTIRYLTEPGDLTSSSDDSAFLWPKKHMSVVLYSALSKAFLMNDDPQGATMQQLADERYQVARADLWLKQYDRPDRVIILDDDYYLG